MECEPGRDDGPACVWIAMVLTSSIGSGSHPGGERFSPGESTPRLP
jgi:hypothetical protein